MLNAPPAQRRSAQACLRCRQQKMRCSGGPEPPCERCAKSGRPCTFEPSTTIQPRPLTSNLGAQEEPAVATRTQYVQSLPLPSSFSSVLSVPSNKRIRVDGSPGPSQQSCSSLPADDDTPYFAVQGLEDEHSRSSLPSAQHLHTPQSDLETADFSGSSHKQSMLQACLMEVDVEFTDAEQMFMLFGERIAPFIPTFYDTDFSTLPATPILVLAAIHSIARYFPDSSSLRCRACHVLERLLKDLLFQTPSQQMKEATETMQGLIILYACCEATSSITPQNNRREHLDMLTMKAIVEGYAVKMRFGVAKKQSPIGPRSCLWWLWLYTMGHHYSLLHGCSRTIGSSPAIQRAKHLVEQNISNARVTAHIGEVELCQLWDNVLSLPGDRDERIEQELQGWLRKWNWLLGKAEGRGLRFHYHFTKFHLQTGLVDFNSNTPVTKNCLDAARDFLQCTTRLPPMSKDRLRYLCDYGFVMMAYVCVFVLRAVKANVVPLHRVGDLLEDVTGIARLMQSFSAKNSTRPAIYGRALEELCTERSNDSTSNGSFPELLSPIMASQMMPTNQAIAASESMAITAGPAWPLGNLSLDRRTPTREGPYFIPQGDDELVNTMTELWGLDSYLSVYGDMILGVPPAE